MKDKHTKKIIIILSILLFIALCYIVLNEYLIWKNQNDISMFNSGAQLGYEQAVAQLYQQASSCQQVPIRYNNKSLTLIAVECLNG